MGPVFLRQQFVSPSTQDEWPAVRPASTSPPAPTQITFLLLCPPLSSCLSYLISPRALPLQVPCRPHFLSTDLILVCPCQDAVISSFLAPFDIPPSTCSVLPPPFASTIFRRGKRHISFNCADLLPVHDDNSSMWRNPED